MSSISSVSSSMSSTMLKQMQEEMFKRVDANGDSSISKDEFSTLSKSGGTQGSADTEAMFAQLDSDSDGAISRLESDAAIAKAGQEMQAQGVRPQGPPPGPPPSGGGAADSEESDTTAIFDAMDTNEDGVVSLAEMTAALDTSGDSTQDPVAQALQDMLDASKESSSATSGSSTSETLGNILASALNSYMEQSAANYGRNSINSTTLSAVA